MLRAELEDFALGGWRAAGGGALQDYANLHYGLLAYDMCPNVARKMEGEHAKLPLHSGVTFVWGNEERCLLLASQFVHQLA